MQISLLLMQQIAQLFLILLMGYAVVKTGLLKASDSKVLSVVFVYLVMPCVVLNAFQIKDTPEIRTGLLYSMGIAVGMHVVFLLLNALFRKALKLDAVEQVNIIYSNAAALVIPIVQALLGEEYVVYSCAFVIVQLVLLWTHASACLQGSARLEWRKLLTNVNLIAIAAGALLYLLHIIGASCDQGCCGEFMIFSAGEAHNLTVNTVSQVMTKSACHSGRNKCDADCCQHDHQCHGKHSDT